MFVKIGNSARAVDEFVAALHHKIRIGAEHEQATRVHPGEEIAIVFRGLFGVVEKSRADAVISLVHRRKAKVESAEQPVIALRSDMKNALAGSGFDGGAG